LVREVGVQTARAAGAVLRDRIASIREVRHKSAIDLVTDVDLESERLVRERILSAFPQHTIVGEEGGAVVGADADCRWIVDPIDGTTNYAHGFPFFCVSIGFELAGELHLGVVYDPSLDELFVAERGRGASLNDRPIRVSAEARLEHALLATGFPYDRSLFPRALESFTRLSLKAQAVRRAGSAALDLCYVACGRFEAYWEHRVNAWDVAAGALLVAEAGGRLSGTDGSPFHVHGRQVLASNGLVHEAVLAALQSDE
jgi:myo-inositol-1(or 4)-monophosphatase